MLRSLTGDPAERTKMFQDAEKLLVEDVGGVFVYHDTPGDLIKPYLKGPALEPDKNGVAAWHWPGFSGFSDLPVRRLHHQRREQLPLDTAADKRVIASARSMLRCDARACSASRSHRTT